MVVIGVLALQGDFIKHAEMLASLGVEIIEVRKPIDLQRCEGLVIPGGESTVMLRQMDFIKLKEPLLEFAQHRPLFGTCAGIILMSQKIESSSMQPLGLLDVVVERNAFGRQVESFHTHVEIQLNSQKTKSIPALFIRAPRIRAHASSVQVLAHLEEEPVFIQQGHHLGATFHPELTRDPTVHQYFIDLVKKMRKPS